MNKYYLGVDAGGTSTRAVILDTKANIWVGRGTAANANTVGGKLARKSIQKAIADALKGVKGIKIKGEKIVKSSDSKNFFFSGIVIGNATLQFKASRKLAEYWLGPYTSPYIRAESDTYTAWAGAHALVPGVVVIAGTGSAVVGVDKHDHRINMGGWGAHYGDEGSAHWIGATAIRLVCQTFDGRIPLIQQKDHLELTKEFFRHFKFNSTMGFRPLFQKSLSVLLGPDHVTQIASFAQSINNLADKNCLARDILIRAGEELAYMALSCARAIVKGSPHYLPRSQSIFKLLEILSKTQRVNTYIPISYSGSNLTKNERVRSSFLRKLRQFGLTAHPAVFPQSVGAALLAMKVGSKGKFTLEKEFLKKISQSVNRIGPDKLG